MRVREDRLKSGHTSGLTAQLVGESEKFFRRSKSSLDTRLMLVCLSPLPVSIWTKRVGYRTGKETLINQQHPCSSLYVQEEGDTSERKSTYPGLLVRWIPELVLIVVKFIINGLGHLLRYLHS